MDPVNFKEANTLMKAPEGMSEEECATMPVYQDEKWCISCWELTGEELMTILQTKQIWLMIRGGQPVTAMTTEKPFTEEAPG